jgi:REP element-mobilizing transposase RayT
MGQSYCSLNYHLVFSTKNHCAMLKGDIEKRIHRYLGGAVEKEGGKAIAINGSIDHVHILAVLRQDKAISDVLRDIKSNASGWVHATFPEMKAFAWQGGYGAFTVSPSQMKRAIRYIQGQKEHHGKISFQEEFMALLDAHGIEYDRRYLFE